MLITPAQRPPLGRAQEEVYVTVYASSLDPFPSEVRTYDVMGRMDLRREWKTKVLRGSRAVPAVRAPPPTGPRGSGGGHGTSATERHQRCHFLLG